VKRRGLAVTPEPAPVVVVEGTVTTADEVVGGADGTGVTIATVPA